MADAVFEAPTAESIAKYVKKNALAVKRAGAGMMMGIGHGAGMESIREDDYEGHHIAIRTSYQIEVDGKDIMGHLSVTNDGQVQYHGLPNYSFDSAMDLVKKMIDVYPDDFAAGAEKPQARRSQGGTGRDVMGTNMSGATVPRMKSRAGKRAPKKAKAKHPAKRPAKGKR
jgi:hypothetical protein